ncbi:MAG: alpha/beta-hydrolase family protein [Actinomycetes bacterium]
MDRSAKPSGPPRWSLLGVLLGSLGYIAALSPTLLPRTSFTQALTCTVVSMTFYAIGAIIEGTVGAILRGTRNRHERTAPKQPRIDAPGSVWATRIRGGIGLAAAVIAVSFTPSSIAAQVAQREHDQVSAQAPNWLLVVLITAALCALVLAIARGLRSAGRGIARLIGRRTGEQHFVLRTLAGGLLVGLCATNVVVIALAACNVFFNTVNNSTANQTPPTSAGRSGGPGSLISWRSLGNQGRNFVGGGPTAQQITAVTGRPAQEPIRTYAGLQSADSIQAQAQLAVNDLVRAGGLTRSAIIVYTPSTNGLVDPTSSAAAEFVLGGNVASVSLQYTVLPSFLSLILSAESSQEAGTDLLSTVNSTVDALPSDHRPRVYVYGESLGAFGSLAPFADKGVAGFLDQVDGAVWAGPPANTAYWQQINALATSGVTWQPIVDDGRVLRYAATPAGIDLPPTPWGTSRGLFLQNATDPVVWWSPNLIFSRPGWLDSPRGPGVPEGMRWLPLVTFEQVLVDMPPAGGMPPGVGHNYLTTIGDGWLAVLAPPVWTTDNQTKLQAALGNTAPPNAANSP